MTELVLRNVCVDRVARRVLDDVSLRVAPGELVALLGANGSGKTTLLRAALGLLPLAGGTVRLGGDDPARLDPRERAKRAAYLPQTRPLAWPIKVRDVVALGRFAHGVGLGPLRGADAAAVERALAACALAPLADRRTDTLSGGELARVHVARALAAEAPLLLADEPTAALDPRHAFETLEALTAFVAHGGACLVTLHDPAEAARVATRLAAMKSGRLIADGPPAEVLTPSLLAEAYGVKAEMAKLAGRPVLSVWGRAGD